MFICEDKCLKLYKNWSLSRSRGPCEICGEFAICADIPSKYLELKDPPKPKYSIEQVLSALTIMDFFGKPVIDLEKEDFIDDFGNTLVNVHTMESCSGKCTIHYHSEHLLDNKPLLWRNDRGIFEHMCQHGIGHPCPDSLPTNDHGIHGCDGCCTKGGRYESKGITNR